MMGEPYLTNTRTMDGNLNTNLDGNLMTTLAGSEDLIVGRDIEGMNRSTVVGCRFTAIVDDSGEEGEDLSSPSSLPLSSPMLLSSSSPLPSSSSLMSSASTLEMGSSCGDLGRKVMKEEMERKEIETKEMERKETERKEMQRKEVEKKGMVGKEESEIRFLEWMECLRLITDGKEKVRRETEESERKALERKEMEKKKMERKEIERKESERKETERKEMKWMEMEKKEMGRKEMERKEMERKETEGKKTERKEMERKETERKETERKDTEKCVIKIKEGTTELVNRLYESERENAGLKEEIRRLKSSLHLCLEGLLKADAAVKIAQSTMMGLLTSEENTLPPLIREESPSLPPLPQRTNRNFIARSGGDRVSSVVQSPPPMVNRGFEGVETSRKTHKGGKPQEGVAFGDPSTMVTEGRKTERKETERKMLMRKDAERKEIERKETEVKEMERKDMERKETESKEMEWKEKERKETLFGLETGWKLVDGGRKRRDPPLPPLSNCGMDSFGVDVRTTSKCADLRSPCRQQLKVRPPRPPLSTAVMISGRVDGFSYAAALKNARKHIDLETIGIETTNVRKALNGGVLIEIPGEDSRGKAEELMTRLRGVFKESAVVSCPMKKRELRVIGFDESTSVEEIAEAMSSVGDCQIADVKIGPIRILGNGLGTVWVQLPVMAASKLVDKGRIRLGWTLARVELLRTRPLQCYRCWAYGHVRNTCQSAIDRSSSCFKCGQPGHAAGTCQSAAHCAFCQDADLEASHRFGGPKCAAQVQQSTQSGRRRSTSAMIRDGKKKGE